MANRIKAFLELAVMIDILLTDSKLSVTVDIDY